MITQLSEMRPMCAHDSPSGLQTVLAEHRSHISSLTARSRDLLQAQLALEEAHGKLGLVCDALESDHLGIVKEHAALREEHEAMRDILLSAGFLKTGHYQRRLSARRATGIFRAMLQAPELALAVGSMSGVASARRICELSKAHSSSMRPVIPCLTQKQPPDLYVFGGKNDNSVALATVERLEGRGSGKWVALPPMPTARYGCAAATVDGRLYVVGGHDGRKVLSVAERFSPGSGSWEKIRPMPTARSRCAAAAVRGKLYVVGGNGTRQRVTSAESFDPISGLWQHLPPMPLVSLGMAAASMRGKLYVVGVDENREMAVECFDPGANTWERQPPVPRQRFGCAAATVAGALHVVGGHDGQQPVATVERFNVASGCWENLSELPTPRHGCAASALAGVLYVVGGDDNKSMMDSVERYDPKFRSWEKLKPLPTGRFGCAAAAAWQ